MSSISGATTTAVSTSHNHRPDPMAAVEKALGMSASDVRSALKSGSSLSDLATKQGVSRDDLLAAIKTDLQNRPARRGGGQDGDQGSDSAAASVNGSTATSTTDSIDQLAAKIADRKGMPGHGHHHHGSNSSLTSTTSSAAAVSSQLEQGGPVDVLL